MLFSARLHLACFIVTSLLFAPRPARAAGVCRPVPEAQRQPYVVRWTNACPWYDADCVEQSSRVCPPRHGVASLALSELLGLWYEVAHRRTFLQRLLCHGTTDATVFIGPGGSDDQLLLQHQAHRHGFLDRAERTLERPPAASDGGGHLSMCRDWFGRSCTDVIVWEVAPDYSYFVISDASGDNVTIYGRAPRLPPGEVQCLLGRLVDAHCFCSSVLWASRAEPHHLPH